MVGVNTIVDPLLFVNDQVKTTWIDPPSRNRLIFNKQWADKVEQLQIKCPECQRIAQGILQGRSLLYWEKRHIEQDVTAMRETINQRIRDGVEMRNLPPKSRRGR